MPTRSNTETKLISALVNTQDVTAAEGFGVSPEMFESHRSEYEWLLSFPRSFGRQPSAESLLTQFDTFPFSDTYIDVAFISASLKRNWHRKQMVIAVTQVSAALRDDDVEGAYDSIKMLPHPDLYAHDKPKNVIADESVLKVIEESTSKIRTPWKTLQEHTGGPSNGDVWTVAARLKQGKSWTLACLIVEALMQGHGVMLFSLEMPLAQVLPRIHVVIANLLQQPIQHSQMRGQGFDPIAYRRLIRLIRDDVPGQLFVKDTSEGPVSTMHIQSMTKDCDMAVIDHLGLMTTTSGHRAAEDWRFAAIISNTVKELAVSNNIPIIIANQINREGESTGWKPPKARNLSQTDAVGQDSDVIITMKQRTKHVAVYSLEENRHGESSVLWHTRFDPNQGKFEEISKNDAEDIIDGDLQKEEREHR